jgi:hypothetical protein
MWKLTPCPAAGHRFAATRRPAFRPQLEALEGRMLPAPLAVGVVPYASEAFAMVSRAPAAATHEVGSPMTVMVNENSPATVINLGEVFGVFRGLRGADGLQLAVLGNTNPSLVKTKLSETELTLTCAAGKCGKATITVSATDADGVSVQETLVVTVVPRGPAGMGESPLPAGAKGW